MKWNKKFFIKLAALAMVPAMILTACGGGSSQPAASTGGGSDSGSSQQVQTIKMRLTHPAMPEHVWEKSSQAFSKEVQEATNGAIKIDVFGGNQLGSLREQMEQLQMGSIELGVIPSPYMTSYVADYNVLDIPYLFDKEEDAYRNLDGKFGQFLADKLEKEVGLKTLGFWEMGFSNIAQKKRPAKTAEDVKGMRFRLQPSPILSDMFSALGVEPVNMEHTELYSAFQQGMLDGQTHTFGTCEDIKCYEVIDYFNETKQTYSVALLVINKSVFESLSPELQNQLVELGKKHTQLEREMNQKASQELKESFKGKGMTIVEQSEIDIDSFKKALQPVKEKYMAQYKEVVDLLE